MTRNESVHPVDRHVGFHIRRLRRQMGVSQQALGERLGVSFQQVQKYENGVNRISASALHGVAAALKVPVSVFFEGLDPTGGREAPRDVLTEMLATAGGFELARAWLGIPSGSMRARLTALAEAIGEPS
jgi:transcriptional regulator with XRE-family HTH domain